MNRCSPLCGALLLFAAWLPSGGTPPAAATLRNLPPYAPGFPRLFPRPVDIRPREGSVLAADLDADGKPELIAAVPSGFVTVVGTGGKTLRGWPRGFSSLPPPAYPVGAPGVGDLDGDGTSEVVFCVSSGWGTRATYLVAVRADGTDLPGWPLMVPSDDLYTACSPGATLVADLDGDGRAEVARSASPGTVWVFNADGEARPGWPFRSPLDAQGRKRYVNADLAAADLDGDGRPEIVFVESGFTPRLTALDAAGRMMPGFPIRLQEVVDRQAPAAGDLDGDGRAEIAQATLPFSLDLISGPPELSSLKPPPVPDPAIPAQMHSLHQDGSEARGWPKLLDGGAAWGALLADLDSDGQPEIVLGDGDRLFAWSADGTEMNGFPFAIHRDFPHAQSERLSQWSVADLDRDGRLDFLQARSLVDAGTTQMRLLGLRSGGQPMRGFPFTLDGLEAASNPVAVDLTGDGYPEIAILATEGTNGGWRLLAWDVWGDRHGRPPGIHPTKDQASAGAVEGPISH